MLSTAHACGIFVIFLGHSLSGKKVLAIVLEFFHIIVLTISQVYRKPETLQNTNDICSLKTFIYRKKIPQKNLVVFGTFELWLF